MEYELSASCANLKDTDYLSKSDPMLLLLQKVAGSKKFVEIGRTEVIKDCLFPEFAQKFRIKPAADDKDRTLRIAVVDIDNFDKIDQISKQEFIGRTDFQESDLLKSQRLELGLTGEAGHVTLKVIEVRPDLDGTVQLELKNGNFELDNKPAFLEIHRADQPIRLQQQQQVQDKDFTLVYRSEQAMHANFQPISASLYSFSFGDLQQLLRVSCWRCSSRGNHKKLATAFTSLAELKRTVETEANPVLTLSNESADALFLRIVSINVHASCDA